MESPIKSVGVVIDGIRPGLKIDVNKISEDLSKRRPNKIGTTSRVEKDKFIINSGLLNEFSQESPININMQMRTLYHQTMKILNLIQDQVMQTLFQIINIKILMILEAVDFLDDLQHQ